MIFAISAVSESCDHYLWCEQGTPDEVIQKMQAGLFDEFAYLHSIDVEPLIKDTLNSQYAHELKDKIRAAIDTAMDDL